MLGFTPSPPSWQLFLFTSIDFLPLEPTPPHPTHPLPLQLSLFQLQRRGLLSTQSEEDDWKRTSKKEKGGVEESKKGCTAAQMEKELPSQRKGRELSSWGFEATLRVGEKGAERGLSGEDVTGLFLPRVMQTTFYHLEKQARGRRGGGQINTSLKSWSQEMVLFLLNDDATYFQPTAIINYVLIPLKVKQGKPSYFLLLIVHIWHCQIKHSME